jgi:protein-tyrosine phosphatase
VSDAPLLADLHCHLVPGVDDGAETFRDALVWLESFAEDGIMRVATTPHLPARLADSDYRRRVEDRFTELAARAADGVPGVDLSLGYEVRLDGSAIDPDDRGLWLGPERHVLVEFQGLELPADPERELRPLLSAGLVPVLAHPERYAGIGEEEAWIARWREMGVLMCVNAGSLWGGYGREPRQVALAMLARGEADLVGSDHHARQRRSDTVREAWDLLRDAGHPDAAERLVSSNPRAVLDGGELRDVPPAPLAKPGERHEAGAEGRASWWRFLGVGGR